MVLKISKQQQQHPEPPSFFLTKAFWPFDFQGHVSSETHFTHYHAQSAPFG